MTLQINGVALSRGAQRIGSKAYSLVIARGFHEWGKASVAVPPLRVGGEQWISVGSRVYFGTECWLNASPIDGPDEPIISIGDGCSFAGSCVVSAVSRIKVGSEVLFARNVYIADHDHAYADTTRAILRQGVMNVCPVVIEDGAWLGQNAVITSGVHIGRGAVVGAGAVVTRDVPDHCLAVGVPAKVVRCWTSRQAVNNEYGVGLPAPEC